MLSSAVLLDLALVAPWADGDPADPDFSGRGEGEREKRVEIFLLYLHGEIPVEETSVSQQPCPELHTDYPKDEEDEEAQEEDVA